MFEYEGKWVNEEGNELAIKKVRGQIYRIKYKRKDNRILFANKWKLLGFMRPFGLRGKVAGDELVVDLEGPMGPSLVLRQLDDKTPEILTIEIRPSLYDGFEHIMGIQCFMPLSPFRRIG